MFKQFLPFALLLFPLGAHAVMEESKLTDRPESKADDPHLIAPGLKWTLNFRGRYEDQMNFRFGGSSAANNDNFYTLRMRPGLQWDPNPQWSLTFEGQVATVRGSDAINEKATPNNFEENLDLHIASAEYKGDRFRAKIGRQKINYANQRLLGSGEWLNTSRVLDAAKISFGDPKGSSWDFIAAKPVAVNPRDWNDHHETGNRYFNSALYGAIFNSANLISGGSFSAHYLLRDNDLNDDSVSTVGLVASKTNGQISYDGELNYQFGTFAGADHRAMAAHAGIKYQARDRQKTALNAMFNWASGDDDPTDGTHGTFDNLYPTNHMHYGEMDFFAWMNMKNFEVGVTQVYNKLTVRAAYHWFWLDHPSTDAWYSAGGSVLRAGVAGASSFVGNELDLVLRYTHDDSLNWALGYCHFFPGGFVDDTGPNRPAKFLYFMINWKL